MEQISLPVVYAPGFVESSLEYGKGGVTLYNQYMEGMKNLMIRPNAVAFVGMGGMLSSIAQLYDSSILGRYLEGPSAQLSEYGKGRIFKDKMDKMGPIGEAPVFYVTDSVSQGEIDRLLGKISTGSAVSESWLWPPLDILEEESFHFNGMMTKGAQKIFLNLFKHIDKGQYKWETWRNWVKYLCASNKVPYGPEHVLTEEDVRVGDKLLRQSFPLTWQKRSVLDIQVPEQFQPLTYRD
ncbi:hypothetical protein C8J57DRAFT_1057997 [Mycena rebaudengoi]|nr:hypothetical protein C8J57DRAFT_1057997 [Mycena rebaudengoi]